MTGKWAYSWSTTVPNVWGNNANSCCLRGKHNTPIQNSLMEWNGPLHRLRELCWTSEPNLAGGLWKNTTGPLWNCQGLGTHPLVSKHLVLGEDAGKLHMASGQASWTFWKSQSSTSARGQAGEDYLSRISKIYQTFPSLHTAQSLLRILLFQLTRSEYCKNNPGNLWTSTAAHHHSCLERAVFPNVVPPRGAGTATSQNSGS